MKGEELKERRERNEGSSAKNMRVYVSFFFFFCIFAISWAALAAYGGSQARGLIGPLAAGLRHSHSNTGSEPHLQPTPQLVATLDPEPTSKARDQTHNLRVLVDSSTTEP